MNAGNQPPNQSGHDHGHIHDHDHHHDHGHRSSAPGAFRWSIVLNSGITALQLVIGFGFGSVALIGDALGDVAGLFLGWGAERLSQRPASGRFTYGYGRSTHRASLVNGVLLLSAGNLEILPFPMATLRSHKEILCMCRSTRWLASMTSSRGDCPPVE